MSLLDLPYELVSYVVYHLNLTDIHSLSLSSRRFLFLFHEPNIAKLLLESKAPHSAEASDARATGRYAFGLRRLLKRRDATASVSPFLVAIVGVAEKWLYENGALCYLRRHQLRVLDLHHSGSQEIVLDLRQLLRQELLESRERRKYKFDLLYYSHSFVSLLYTQTRHDQPGSTHWLVVLNILDGKTLLIRPMLFIDKIIVRNNDKFLYCGTYFEVEPEGDDDDERRGQWMLRGFDITTRTWFDDSLNIPAMIGSDIGSTVCFEILDGYFYGLSNQTSLQVELVDWVSHYTCFRFPLSRTGFQDLESPSRNQLWRRNQTEGPIDDRWRFLRMEKDETTGQLKIVECRKEWLSCNTSARRTYYTTPISFGEPGKSSNKRHSLIEGLSLDKVRQVAVSRSSARDPHMVHPDDDTLTLTTMPNKCPIRSYHSGSQTIIDLVDDSPSLDSRDQRIRICGRTRRLAPGALAQQDARSEVQDRESPDEFLRRIKDLYRSRSGMFWPPELSPQTPDSALADLYAVLNPRDTWETPMAVGTTGLWFTPLEMRLEASKHWCLSRGTPQSPWLGLHDILASFT